MKKKLLKVLRELKADGPDYSEFGICTNIYKKFGHFDWEVILEDLFEAWPKFSGCTTYPIKEFPLYDFNENKWSGESGKLRYELIDFLISELEKETK